ncbi:MAG: DUF2975 domain-containing protein [Terracidiphilus sp.]|jgi:hypothetical protein
MNLIGPKSIASKLHLVVKILFFLQIARVLLMAIAPILPSSTHQYLSFDVQSGPLEFGFNVFRGTEARWWIWGMELVSRTCHLVVLYLLMRILEPVGIGELFHLKTPSRLRMMGCAVVAGSLLRTVFCAELLRLGLRPEPGVWISWAIDFDAIFMGILLVVLAEVFRRGYALKTESELTV